MTGTGTGRAQQPGPGCLLWIDLSSIGRDGSIVGFSEFGAPAKLPHLMGGVAQNSALGKDPCGSWIARGGHRYLLLGMCTYPLLRLWPLRVPPLRRLTLESPKVSKCMVSPPPATTDDER